MNLLLSRLMRNVVEVALGVGIVEVNGGREEMGFDGFEADGHFHGSGGAEKVAEARFGGADRDFFGIRT